MNDKLTDLTNKLASHGITFDVEIENKFRLSHNDGMNAIIHHSNDYKLQSEVYKLLSEFFQLQSEHMREQSKLYNELKESSDES